MISNYEGGFDSGITLRGMPLSVTHPGKVFWVGNSASLLKGEKGASDGTSNKGTFHQPYATIDYAVGQCKANRGDIIVVRPNHTETVATASAVDLDVEGIAVIGLGNGDNLPRLDFTATAGTVAVGADNVLMANLNFHANVPAVVDGLIMEDGINHCSVINCLFDAETSGTDEFIDCISMVNNNSRCVIEGCTMDMGIGDGAVAGIHMDADTAFTVIHKNVIRGDFSTANIVGDTTLSTNLDIDSNLLENGVGGNLNAQPCIELLTGSTGTIRDNYLVCNVAAATNASVSDTCLHFQNKYNETIDTTGINLEVADA